MSGIRKRVKVIHRVYRNAEEIKLPNKRVVVIDEKGGVRVVVKRLSNVFELTSHSDHIGGKILKTTFRLSNEAAEALMICLQSRLERKAKYE